MRIGLSDDNVRWRMRWMVSHGGPAMQEVAPYHLCHVELDYRLLLGNVISPRALPESETAAHCAQASAGGH